MNGSVAAYQSMAQMNGYDENKQRSAIQEYMKNGGVNLDPAVTAWCAGIVNAALAQQGIKGTGKLNARSFMEWGQGVDQPTKGDIAVFSRGDPNGWQGHVGFFDGYGDDGSIRVLGGNQSDAVNVSSYPADRLLGFRRPGENPAAVQNRPQTPQNTRAAVQNLSTRSSPQTEAPMQPEQATGLLGSLFPNMTADRQDRLAMGLSGLSMFPNQGVMQGAQQRMGERRDDRKEAKGQASAQQQANRTLEVLRQAGVSEQDLQIAAGSPEYLRALIGQVAQTRLAGPTKPNWSWNSDIGQYVDMNDPTNTYQPANSGNVSALDKDQMSTLNALSDDATRDLKTSEEMRSSYQRIQSFAGGQAVSDVALVTAFAKLLDPGSVVREGEAAAISQSGSLSEAFKQSMLNALTGQGQLPPEVKQEIVSLSRSLYYDTAQDARHTIQGYQDRASRGGLGGETVYLGSDFTSPAQPQSSLRPQSRGQGQQRPDASPQSSSAGSAPSEIQLRSAISQLSAYDQQLLGSIPTARGQIDFLRSKGLLP
jgi:uncharacterized protein (TIGR02594 family)